MEFLQEAAKDLTRDAAITLFVEGCAADHPGIRPATVGHYREQLANRPTACATSSGCTSAMAGVLQRH